MKKVGFIISGLLLLLGIPVSVYFMGQQQDIRSRAAPATTLSLTPSNDTKKVGDIATYEVVMNTAGNQVVTAKINLTFDATKLEAQSITNGSMLSKIYESANILPGSVSIMVGAQSELTPANGTGTIAIIRMKVLAGSASAIPIQFGPSTFVGGIKEKTTNVLVSTTPARLTVASSQADLPITTPQVTAAPEPVVTAAPIETVTPSVKVTPTLKVSPMRSTATTSGALIGSIEGEKIATGAANSTATAVAVAENQPQFTGKAAPGSTITIVIHSEQTVTAIVTADADGNWVYTPDTALETGDHTVTVTSQTEAGATDTSTVAFAVDPNAENNLDPMPTSGAFENTLLLIGLSTLFFISSIVVFRFKRI